VVAVELRDLTVKNTGGCAYATAIRSDSLPLRLRSVTATASGGTSETRGILLAGERGAKLTQVTADADGTGSSLAIAVKLVYSPADSLDDVDAHAYGASPSGGNTALLLENSYALVRSSWLETRRASDPTVQSTQDSFVTVLWSLLDGGVPVRDFGSETTCGADFNHNDPVAVVAC
jgi:hypothetical protein